ncbi:MAG: DUF5655 domain-containing protein [Gemmatimonadales bacterium]
MATRKLQPLWACPRCGHRFVGRNMWHSCGRHPIADHFRGRPPLLRALFRRFRALVRSCGPVTVYAQKTRIVFQARARFTSVVVRRGWLEGAVWLKRRLALPRFHRIEKIPPGDYVHYFSLRDPSEIDAELAALVREAYAVGRQEHLRPPAARR